jgi:hypothetical protein
MDVRSAMRRWVFLCAVAGSAAVATADTPKGKKDGLPPGVTMVARGVWGGGASPDGAKFAHFTGMKSRQLAILTVATGESTTIATGEKSCSASACLDDRCGLIAWSHDGARLAMRTDDGLWEVDVAAKTKRRVDSADRRAACKFRFAADGPLEYLAPGEKGTALWRDGETDSVVELPQTANAHEIGDTVVVTGRWAADGYRGAFTDLWIVDRTHRRIRRVYHHDPDDDGKEPMWDPRLSPDESRVCWQGLTAVRCALTRNGKTVEIGETGDAGGRWGHERTQPFSPSGNLLAFRVSGDGGDVLMVHDFANDTTRDVLAPLRHQDFLWQNEDTLLLYEQEDSRDATIPPIVRLDLTDGDDTAVVSSAETQYNAPVVIPGNADVVFFGRERPKTGSRDLVRVDIPAAIKGANR